MTPGRLAIGVLSVVLVGAFFFHSRDPVYQGKPVSAWVDELGDNSYLAADALRKLGPEAVRPLIDALERKPARWLKACAAVSDHAPRLLKA